MSQLKAIVGIAVLFSASTALGYFSQAGSTSVPATNAVPESPAIWASDARTPDELVAQADAVVRVQVLDRDDTYFVVPQPFQQPRTAARLAAQGQVVPRLPFTPSVLEVLEVYSGDVAVGDRIKILQTGGLVDGQKAELTDDPLYDVGTEQLLFLRNVSSELGDRAKAATFVTVNPAGRYRVLGDQLVVETPFIEVDPTAPPLSLSSLEGQIRSAVQELEGPSLRQ
ncbi:MAG: hypothetical protein KDD11_18920 [Acidobacteria bacterium]|nr:hypothetical protein [Acidobacteriota bacterium]